MGGGKGLRPLAPSLTKKLFSTDTLAVLDGELAVPCNPKTASGGVEFPAEGHSAVRSGGQRGGLDPTQQTLVNPVRSGRKQR